MNHKFHKDLIYEGFFPQKRYAHPNFLVAQKAVENYQSISTSQSDSVEMMLYYVETGSDFLTNLATSVKMLV